MVEGIDLNTLVTSIGQYGAIGACLAYFMWERSNTLRQLTEVVGELKDVLISLRGKELI